VKNAVRFSSRVQSLARFIGPVMIVTFDLSDRNTGCNFSNPNKYVTYGCKIHDYYIMSGIYIGISAVIMLGASARIFSMRRVSK